MVANAATRPVTSSVSANGGSIGSPPGTPVIDASPDIASAIDANPGRCAYGPSWPKPLTRVMMSFGLRACNTSGAKPKRSKIPGRKFSTNTSASSMSRRNTSRSDSFFRSSATVRLLRFTSLHHRPSPSAGSRQPMLRKLSPPSGRSILMTSAPKSAR